MKAKVSAIVTREGWLAAAHLLLYGNKEPTPATTAKCEQLWKDCQKAIKND